MRSMFRSLKTQKCRFKLHPHLLRDLCGESREEVVEDVPQDLEALLGRLLVPRETDHGGDAPAHGLARRFAAQSVANLGEDGKELCENCEDLDTYRKMVQCYKTTVGVDI